MKRKGLSILILSIVFCTISILSQNKKENQDFSGKWLWKVNDDNFHQIEIEQNGVEIKIKETIKREDQSSVQRETIYFTDKRGEINKFYENKTIESITVLRENKITTEFFDANSKSNKKRRAGSREMKLKDKKLVLTEVSGLPTLILSVLGRPQVSVKIFKKV